MQTLSKNLSTPVSNSDDWREGGFGLYVHWPFCQAKCPYCDFNSHVVRSIDTKDWTRAYLSEIKRIAADTRGRVLSSVFFGGGTPSLMEPETVEAILEAVASAWPMANAPEITLEANPTSVEAERFKGFRNAGVNRVSLGVQALNDTDLQRLGRLHSAADARQAYDIARRTFERVSFDLIYARQFQTLDAWRDELASGLEMAADHLSLYQLTIEPGTAFGDRHARGTLGGLPDEGTQADMYDLTQEMCAKTGMYAYEVSNHALPGSESRHNMIYWRYGDYAGIGPGAHGRLTLDGQRFATDTPLAPGTWLKQVQETGNGERPRKALSVSDQRAEYLMMGLRLAEGVSIRRLQRLGFSLDGDKLKELQDFGLLARSPDRLYTTRRGRALLNEVLRELIDV